MLLRKEGARIGGGGVGGGGARGEGGLLNARLLNLNSQKGGGGALRAVGSATQGPSWGIMSK
jgi:hypothetical protein